MNQEVTLTVGQIFWLIGGIAVIVLIIVLIKMVMELTKTLKEFRQVGRNVNDIIDDIQVTKLAIVEKVAELKRATDIVKKFKEIKDSRSEKQLKKKKKKGAN